MCEDMNIPKIGDKLTSKVIEDLWEEFYHNRAHIGIDYLITDSKKDKAVLLKTIETLMDRTISIDVSYHTYITLSLPSKWLGIGSADTLKRWIKEFLKITNRDKIYLFLEVQDGLTIDYKKDKVGNYVVTNLVYADPG